MKTAKEKSKRIFLVKSIAVFGIYSNPSTGMTSHRLTKGTIIQL